MSYHQDDPLNIDTPENVVFAYDVAGIGSRFIAAILDTLLIIGAQIFIAVFVLIFSSDLNQLLSNYDEINPWIYAAAGLISFMILWGFYIIFEMIWNGQTPGKRMVKLRVVRLDGTPITLADSLIRNILRLIDFLPFNYALGVIVMFVNKQSRRIGDLAAGTLVIRDYKQEFNLDSLNGFKISPQRLEVGPPILEGVGALPVEKLSDADIRLAREFLARDQQQTNLEALAKKIVKTLLKKMEIVPQAADKVNATRILFLIVEYYEYLQRK